MDIKHAEWHNVSLKGMLVGIAHAELYNIYIRSLKGMLDGMSNDVICHIIGMDASDIVHVE